MIEKLNAHLYKDTTDMFEDCREKINELVDVINAITIDVDGTKCVDGSAKVKETDQNLNFEQQEVKEKAPEIIRNPLDVQDIKSYMSLSHNALTSDVRPTQTDPYAEQKKWIRCLCWFWNDSYDDKDCSILTDIPAKGFSDTYASADGFIYKHCEPVKPDDDIIYQELTPEYLRNLMATPKYWKEQDPETVRRVEEGFKKLYGDKGE